LRQYERPTSLGRFAFTAKYLNHLRRGMAAVQQNTTYHKELFSGAVVSIRTKLLEVRDRVIRFRQEIIHDESGEIAAISELTGVHIDQNTRRACAFPSEIVERLRRLFDSTGNSDSGSDGQPITHGYIERRDSSVKSLTLIPPHS